MRNLLFLISGLVLLSACSKSKDPNPVVAGSYYGRLYITTSYPAQGYYLRRVVDTTLQVTTTDNTTFSIFGRQLVPSSTSYDWLGHKPMRGNYSLESGFGYSNGIILQKEKQGDSIYVDYRKGGLSAGTYYSFYAKKQ